MKILFLTHKFNPDIGGIESVSEMLADEFSKQGHAVRVLTWSEKKADKTFNYRVIRRPRLIQILSEMHRADVVFENNPCLRLSWPNLLTRKPLVVALHTWLKNTSREIGLQEKMKLSWLRKANQVIACSEALRKATFPAAITIGNPYDDKTFVADAAVRRINDYIFLGRLVSDKGVQIAIEAISIALQLEPQLFEHSSITIVGDGPERKVLENQAQELGLQNRIIFTGSKKGHLLVEELNRHRYLLVPSLWQEPFGIVVLEGQACGCLPIVARSGGLPDAVGAAGELFECGNAASLAQKMIFLKQNPSYEAGLRAAIPGHLKQHLSSSVAQRYLKVLQGAAHKSGEKISRAS